MALQVLHQHARVVEAHRLVVEQAAAELDGVIELEPRGLVGRASESGSVRAWGSNDVRPSAPKPVSQGRCFSHRAADYRYLSERLRAMIFLPHVGSLRAPPHLSQPYATRVATQGIIDRLFDSIARQAEPLKTLGAAEGKTIRPDAQAAMRVVGSEWIAVQGDYHHNNAIVLQGMTHWLESGARRLNGLIIAIVLIDLALVALDMAGLVPHMLSTVLHQGVEPVLIAMAAILPAAVASMNGVRFQSEFSRLADRSEQMKYELAHLEKRARMLWQRSDRMLDVLHVAEDAARLTLDEVADWTALYGQEVLEM